MAAPHPLIEQVYSASGQLQVAADMIASYWPDPWRHVRQTTDPGQRYRLKPRSNRNCNWLALGRGHRLGDQNRKPARALMATWSPEEALAADLARQAAGAEFEAVRLRTTQSAIPTPENHYPESCRNVGDDPSRGARLNSSEA
jgi:hypothetical protein